MKEMAKLFKALSEDVRLRILGLLCQGELCVCDLMAVLDLPQSTISRHLSYLTNAGWLAGERRGVWMYYRLIDDGGDLQQDLMAVLIKHLAKLPAVARDYARLTQYLKTKNPSACG
ncbi:MAG: metalloregulator ArsR/SmtB family transcription factor [Proteobacteria bacterium]|nr:metalloregulator ArsR/SmtB family transcription factor [Pseudomonadota bacterium]MBU0966675.1 metalloregulator ArsR/SmtB family transcription factor [Pseudomonadota bacterium]